MVVIQLLSPHKATFDAEAVLVAIGRKPATDELELHNAEIKTDERGYNNNQ